MVKNTATCYLFHEYKTRMRKKGLEFNLPYETFIELISLDCYLCGKKPGNRARRNVRGKDKKIYRKVEILYSGLDRIDNSKGYIAGNVAPCCATCNSIKSALSIKELAHHLMKMLKHLREFHAKTKAKAV